MAHSTDINMYISRIEFLLIGNATSDFMFYHLFKLNYSKLLDINTLNLVPLINTPK